MPAPQGDSPMAMSDGEFPSTATDEKRAIGRFLEAAESQIKEGDMHYLISYRWWKQWKAYVGDDVRNSSNGVVADSRRPSSIDNSDLLCLIKDECDLNHELREFLKENHDYILVPEQVWMAYHKWYGGGPAIARRVINSGYSNEDSLEVEVYPLRLRLIFSTRGNEIVLRMSKNSTIADLSDKACEVFDLGSEDFRIWDYKGRRKNFLLSNSGQMLQEAKLQMDHDILVEVKVEGNWPDDVCLQCENGYVSNELALVPVEPSRLGFSIAGGPTGSRSIMKNSTPDLILSHSLSSSFKSLEERTCLSSESTRVGTFGLTGLQNLGNTCFMNSAIQCLAHTPELVEFFLQDYSHEINRQNPLGMEGELAIAFGDLLRKLWAEGRTPIAPRAFKAKLTRFAAQFSGYNQHDSQELLAFLLDGLHEDLNRVKLKPYLESKDAAGRPDDVVAHEYWENHKARNDSIIVDICQGQYKSTLVCPFCNKVSVTFDPFMYLSLPLPSTIARPIIITVYSCNGSAPPTPYTIPVLRQAKCEDVIQVLSKVCQLQNDEKLLLMELYNQRSYRFLDEFSDWISRIHETTNFIAYRLTKGSEKLPFLVFVHRRFEEDLMPFQHIRQLRHFGAPLIAPLPEEGLHTGAELLNFFENLLRPLKKIEQLSVVNDSEKGHFQNGASNHKNDLEMIDLQDSALNDVASVDNVDMEFLNSDRADGFQEQSAKLFQFSLTEEKNMGRDGVIHFDDCLPSAFNSYKISSKIHVTVDWSEDALTKYDVKLLEPLPEVQKSGFPAKKAHQEAVSLYTCLEAFLKEEPLGPEDMWYCPCCKEHRQASKKLDLWRLPEILVVHLKRFSYSRFSKNKLETFVNFPINDLDLTKYIARKDGKRLHRYELYAVSNHYGSMGGGHYTAYAKLSDGKQWYNFDDSHVSPVSENEIMTAAAYVLFYRRIKTTDSMLSNGSTMLIKRESLF